MKGWLLLVMVFFVVTPANAAGHKNDDRLMNKEECTELKAGIAELLLVADYYRKEIEKDTEKKELYEAAAFYSQQAANYSTVYHVWCD